MRRRVALFCAVFAGLALLAGFAPRRCIPKRPARPRHTGHDAIDREAQTWLTDLIRINTTNPPGNEQAAAKYMPAVLQKENIPAEVLEIAPGRASPSPACRPGPLPDSSKALLLLAHLDVVGVDKAKWSVDPFGATLKDDYIYGRGAIDDKGMVAANLAAIIELKRSATRLNRDVIFLADDDEEQGGDASIRVVIEKYWDKIACAFASTKAGASSCRTAKCNTWPSKPAKKYLTT